VLPSEYCEGKISRGRTCQPPLRAHPNKGLFLSLDEEPRVRSVNANQRTVHAASGVKRVARVANHSVFTVTDYLGNTAAKAAGDVAKDFVFSASDVFLFKSHTPIYEEIPKINGQRADFPTKFRYSSVYCSVPTSRAALYLRVSNQDHNPQPLHDLQQFASQRGCEVVEVYSDRNSGTKAKRPAWNSLLADARRRKFDVVIAQSLTDVASSVRHCLSLLDQLNQLGVGLVAFREKIDTTDPTMVQGMAAMVSALSQLERTLRIANVRAGMRRSKLEGVHIGRTPLPVNRTAIVEDRLSGLSLTSVGKKHGVSRAMVCRLVRLASEKTNIPSAHTEESLMLAESA
jgi:DNA invertase Pin-like site-specific DNA recombinase